MANDTDEGIILDHAVQILAKQAEISTIRESINKLKADIKGMGINLGDFNFALKKFADEPETRDASFTSITRCLAALQVSYEPMFPGLPKAGKARAGDVRTVF